MKICLIASFPESIVAFRGPLIEEMVKAGLEVHVAAPRLDRNSEHVKALNKLGAECHSITLSRTGTGPLTDGVTLWDLHRLFTRLRPGLVLAYTVKPVIYGVIAAWTARVPKRFALITGLGYAFTEGRSGMLVSLVQMLYRYALSKSTKVLFQNPDDMDLFRSLRLISREAEAVVVNGSGVDVEYFFPVPICTQNVSFILIARLLGDKGVREYAAAAQRVKAVCPFVKFSLVGWIDSNPDAIGREELDGWIRSGAIEFEGRLNDVRPALRSASVYVLPSYREGTPRTVLEAMAMGLPVITTDAPGCRETVVDGENGFLVPVRSVDALVDAMMKFISEPALVKRMGHRSRQIVEQKYDVRKVNAVMLREMGIEPQKEAI